MESILIGTVVIGFSESIASMQIFLKIFYISDLTTLEHKIKVQYASVGVGVTFAFGLGGVIYEEYDIDGVAVFGIVLSTLEMLSLLTYALANKMCTAANADQNVNNTNGTSATAEELGKSPLINCPRLLIL